eukprot:6190780-Pleurochrysis_carterae.AAC.1
MCQVHAWDYARWTVQQRISQLLFSLTYTQRRGLAAGASVLWGAACLKDAARCRGDADEGDDQYKWEREVRRSEEFGSVVVALDRHELGEAPPHTQPARALHVAVPSDVEPHRAAHAHAPVRGPQLPLVGLAPVCAAASDPAEAASRHADNQGDRPKRTKQELRRVAM